MVLNLFLINITGRLQILRISPGSKSDSISKKEKGSLLPASSDNDLQKRMLAELIILRTLNQGSFLIVTCYCVQKFSANSRRGASIGIR